MSSELSLDRQTATVEARPDRDALVNDVAFEIAKMLTEKALTFRESQDSLFQAGNILGKNVCSLLLTIKERFNQIHEIVQSFVAFLNLAANTR